MKLKAAGVIAGTVLLSAVAGSAAWAETADLVMTNGVVLTMDATRSTAEAVAVTGNKIVFVGSSAEAKAFIGANTKVIDAKGQPILPGLHDVHIHPLYTVEPDFKGAAVECNFDNAGVSMDDTVAKLKACLSEAKLNPGGWLIGRSFAPPSLLSTTATYPTVLAALDAVSTTVPIQLAGSDGHAAGFNSAALKLAVHPDTGKVVPVNGASLKTDYAAYAEYFNVDAAGEPDGTAKDFAQFIVAAPEAKLENYKGVLKEIDTLLSSNGVTSVQDAMVHETQADIYAFMEQSGQLDFRLRLNTHLDSNLFGGRTRPLDIDRAMKEAVAMRDRFKDSAYIKADGVKLFVDGVVEYPTQTAAMINPYREPIMDADDNITSYVDQDSALCLATATDIASFEDSAKATAFETAHGFAPDQCVKRYGILEFQPAELTKAVTAFDKAGFTVHMHALGDRAVRESLNAIAAARAANGESGLPHNLSHIQFVDPADVTRIGEMKVTVTPTYSWAVPFWGYDITVNPYIDEVTSIFDIKSMYRADSRWHRTVYPFNSIRQAGGILAAGSDAPVNVPTPQPWVNIAAGLTRADLVPVTPPDTDGKGEKTVVAVNAGERLTLDDLLAAYTINGAQAMGQQTLTGSIEVGKKADLILIDRDIRALATSPDTAWDIAATKVTVTVFDGRIVWDQR